MSTAMVSSSFFGDFGDHYRVSHAFSDLRLVRALSHWWLPHWVSDASFPRPEPDRRRASVALIATQWLPLWQLVSTGIRPLSWVLTALTRHQSKALFWQLICFCFGFDLVLIWLCFVVDIELEALKLQKVQNRLWCYWSVWWCVGSALLCSSAGTLASMQVSLDNDCSHPRKLALIWGLFLCQTRSQTDWQNIFRPVFGIG